MSKIDIVKVRIPGTSWEEAATQFCYTVNSRKELEKLVTCSATLTNSDDGRLFTAYFSDRPVHTNWNGKILQFEVVKGSYLPWDEFLTKFEHDIEKYDLSSVIAISITESPKSHTDCIGIIWWIK